MQLYIWSVALMHSQLMLSPNVRTQCGLGICEERVLFRSIMDVSNESIYLMCDSDMHLLQSKSQQLIIRLFYSFLLIRCGNLHLYMYSGQIIYLSLLKLTY